jgi:hypothetical protein
MGIGLVIGFIDRSQAVTTTKYNTLANSHTTNHSTLNLLKVLSLALTTRFLATDLPQSNRNFKHHYNNSTRTVFNLHINSSWHSLIPSTADSMNSDLRPPQHRKHFQCLAVDVLYCCIFVETCSLSRCLTVGMAQTHVETTSCNTSSIVAYVCCGRCLSMDLPYCCFRICCGLVYRDVA